MPRKNLKTKALGVSFAQILMVFSSSKLKPSPSGFAAAGAAAGGDATAGTVPGSVAGAGVTEDRAPETGRPFQDLPSGLPSYIVMIIV